MTNPDNPRASPPNNWNLMMLADVASKEYDAITSKKHCSKSPSCPSTKPRVSSLSRRSISNSKLMVLAEVVTMFSLAREQEKEARLFVTVPRKKRTHRNSHRSTQWTRVIEKQRFMELQNPSNPETCPSRWFADSKKRRLFNEEERSFKKRRIVRRFVVGSSSSSRVQQINPNLDSPRLFKKPKPVLHTQSTAPPEWLVNVMMREGNGSYNPKLIIARKLYQSDLDRVQARLAMPLKQVVNCDFLTEEESRILYEQSELKIRREGVSVELVDPMLNKHVVDLRKWKMSGNWNYVFVDGWNDVVAKNTFRIHDVIHVWSFRSGTGKLCFALVPPPPPPVINSSQDCSASGEYGH